MHSTDMLRARLAKTERALSDVRQGCFKVGLQSDLHVNGASGTRFYHDRIDITADACAAMDLETVLRLRVLRLRAELAQRLREEAAAVEEGKP